MFIFCAWFYRIYALDKGMVKWVTPLGWVFKIRFFSVRFCRILMSIKGMVKWVTPLGVR